MDNSLKGCRHVSCDWEQGTRLPQVTYEPPDAHKEDFERKAQVRAIGTPTGTATCQLFSAVPGMPSVHSPVLSALSCEQPSSSCLRPSVCLP